MALAISLVFPYLSGLGLLKQFTLYEISTISGAWLHCLWRVQETSGDLFVSEVNCCGTTCCGLYLWGGHVHLWKSTLFTRFTILQGDGGSRKHHMLQTSGGSILCWESCFIPSCVFPLWSRRLAHWQWGDEGTEAIHSTVRPIYLYTLQNIWIDTSNERCS
jgi:hypothetical protein